VEFVRVSLHDGGIVEMEGVEEYFTGYGLRFRTRRPIPVTVSWEGVVWLISSAELHVFGVGETRERARDSLISAIDLTIKVYFSKNGDTWLPREEHQAKILSYVELTHQEE
jgi:predicted RNase H-like HicB family nuclease